MAHAPKADQSSRRQSEAGRFEALDGWRGICALLVVCFHAPVGGYVHASAFFQGAFLFVDFFFVLSGFVITHAFYDRLRSGRDARRFLLARLFRVYPLHLFMLALFVGYEAFLYLTRGSEAAFQEGASPVGLLHNLLMTHSLGVLDGLTWNYPSWSISAELVAYTLFALAMIGARRRLVPLAAMTIPVALAAILWLDGTIDTTFHLGWLRCLAGFSVGVLIRRLLWVDAPLQALPGDRAVWTAAEIAVVGLVIVFVHGFALSGLSLAAPLVFGFALYVFSHEGGWLSVGLKTRPIAFLGTVSYSIYMTHAFVISRAENVVTVLLGKTGWTIVSYAADGKRLMGASEAQSLAALGAIVAATLVASALTFRFVEMPGIAAGRALLRGASSRRLVKRPV
ncbi:acyltransferase family protein [Mangrovibrevibacter kandeliae]|uniref:acyltransferase family protein n=1 Tax=Mangrovibrevibacter kandeliae TaxID=2968473 RepID=UPI002119196E|nr:acyltransferase [Aurantimonas sp. CSK15Z-1]MCQ8783618.1 acyltransferase [Aurantimonas sp. CSK15Z-1]